MTELRGYPVVYESPASVGGAFTEIIRPGAYRREHQADVVALVSHDPQKVLGRQSARSLILDADARGVRASIAVDERISYAADALHAIRRGDATGASFGFYTLTDVWSLRDGVPFREVLDLALIEISPAVVFPVYAAAGFSVVTPRQAPPRSADRLRDETAFRLRTA